MGDALWALARGWRQAASLWEKGPRGPGHRAGLCGQRHVTEMRQIPGELLGLWGWMGWGWGALLPKTVLEPHPSPGRKPVLGAARVCLRSQVPGLC